MAASGRDRKRASKPEMGVFPIPVILLSMVKSADRSDLIGGANFLGKHTYQSPDVFFSRQKKKKDGWPVRLCGAIAIGTFLRLL